ncbi:MAG TPA: MerR family transcriptional regulator [Gammaproteobacteria bacterium]|nr:MerR family transcriptional regulator [Xanthomonadales bacterium]MCB1593630.1 MerR family transcriptional regulator [Xanthomonadales bacterium]HOP22205.1 MerR family transcriptional regulator [Gammaproteobacteria bacterium]HPI95407.1 MerR family transcriptional regulator [Gammaproteobacteria bacterium]HPQ87163.1 MerR family transcriptional regulator [Gammaproteobacteria bacterium]
MISITELSEKTGVNSVTLRAWERRYGLLKPQRTPKGHRFYTQADVDKVIKILNLIEQGVSVSKVKPLLDSGVETSELSENWQQQIDRVFLASESFNKNRIEKIYREISKEYPFSVSAFQFFKVILDELITRKDTGFRSDFMQNIILDNLKRSNYSYQQSHSSEFKTVIFLNSMQLDGNALLLSLLLKEINHEVEIFKNCTFNQIFEYMRYNPIDHFVYIDNKVLDSNQLKKELKDNDLAQIFLVGAQLKLNQEMFDFSNLLTVVADPLEVFSIIKGD